MSEEVLTAAGNIDYWQRRAVEAEMKAQILEAQLGGWEAQCAAQRELLARVVDQGGDNGGQWLPILLQYEIEDVIETDAGRVLLAKLDGLNKAATEYSESRDRWYQAAKWAEADAAALRTAAEIVRSEYSKLLEAPLPDAYAVMKWLRWPVGHLALAAETHQAGAALLAELEAAREVIKAACLVRVTGPEAVHLKEALAAYEAAQKGGQNGELS